MRLRHIEVFHAIMQVGTISGAAQVLHISQPAVTKVLQHAELQLGMPLFERVRGKLYPKPEAHRLFVETEKLHRDLQGIRRLAASLKGNAVETIRLVSTPTIAISVRDRDATADERAAIAAQATDQFHFPDRQPQVRRRPAAVDPDRSAAGDHAQIRRGPRQGARDPARRSRPSAPGERGPQARARPRLRPSRQGAACILLEKRRGGARSR